MEWSAHNIIAPVTGSDNHILVNLLSQQADILDADTARAVLAGNIPDPAPFIEKGYLVDPADEQARYKQRYLDFIDNRDSDEIQLFIVPWYACNFACSYCYQDEYAPPEAKVSEEVIDAFFAYIKERFAGRRKYITVFGGEPLLDSPYHRKTISYLLSAASNNDISVAIVTNGYSLASYIDILKKGHIREIQITLDGPQDVQDTRRPLKGGGGTFSRISDGINAALTAGMPVNLRAVIDKDNLPRLPELARYAKEQGWLKNPLLKTQLGRNYELHHCQRGSDRLYSRIEMYQDLYNLAQKKPIVYEFHRPAYSVSRFLFDNGELPDPLFDACPGTKTEWAFDYTGAVYSCTATVGKSGEELGSFYPTVTMDNDKVAEWEERDVTSIPGCAGCPLQLACGGGCASVAKNREGTINAPDCRPIKELLSLGAATYFKEPEKDDGNED